MSSPIVQKVAAAASTLFSLWGSRFAGGVVGGLTGYLAHKYGVVVDPALVASLTATVYGLTHTAVDLLAKKAAEPTPATPVGSTTPPASK